MFSSERVYSAMTPRLHALILVVFIYPSLHSPAMMPLHPFVRHNHGLSCQRLKLPALLKN